MRKTGAAVAAVLLSIGLAGAAHAGPAAALHGPQDPEPSEGVLLTVSGSSDTWIRGVRLQCSPEPGGPHPHAAEACAELERAQGDPGALTGEPALCSRRFDPVTASAKGTYMGKSVAWRKTFANACELSAATGHVFRF
ncbi:SSI family serine proteinase inhibitor [Streptomyces sp. NPDC048639]|uniref:SSI family serine proteinase inhibitor n=1 Tax=Streptomyces sp. NPDC048639 TaxID=3365581 RepID=UPI00372066DE